MLQPLTKTATTGGCCFCKVLASVAFTIEIQALLEVLLWQAHDQESALRSSTFLLKVYILKQTD